MAFSADELRVLRRALADAPCTPARPTAAVAPRPAEDVQDCLRLAEAVDEAAREAGRLRAFLLADLRRYRDALPGIAAGYLERLRTPWPPATPGPDDLAALRRLRALPSGAPEHLRRTACCAAARPSRRTTYDCVWRPNARAAPPARPPGARLAADPTRRWPCPAVVPRRGAHPGPAEAPTPAEIRPPGRRPAPDAGADAARTHAAPGFETVAARTRSTPGRTAAAAAGRRSVAPPPSARQGPSYSGGMDYVSALVPPVVMADLLHRAHRDDREEPGRGQQGQGGRGRGRRARPRRGRPAGPPPTPRPEGHTQRGARYSAPRAPLLLRLTCNSSSHSRHLPLWCECAPPIGRAGRRRHDPGVAVEPPGDRSGSPGRPSAGTVHRVHHGDDRNGQSPSEGLGAPGTRDGRAYRYEAGLHARRLHRRADERSLVHERQPGGRPGRTSSG